MIDPSKVPEEVTQKLVNIIEFGNYGAYLEAAVHMPFEYDGFECMFEAPEDGEDEDAFDAYVRRSILPLCSDAAGAKFLMQESMFNEMKAALGL